MTYDLNSYGEVTNGEGTYTQAVADLLERAHVVLNWTDERGTLYNVLLSFDPTRVGAPGGIVDSGPGKLWVGVAGRGCFGFGVSRGFVAPEYAAEKLGIDYNLTSVMLAQLITEIRTRLGAEITTKETAQ